MDELDALETLASADSLHIGLISDTHIPEAAPRLWSQVFDVFHDVDCILHAGDIHDLSVIDELSEDALREVIRDYGEERHARAIARTLKREVPQTTSALANIVRAIVPQGKSKVDPATHTA